MADQQVHRTTGFPQQIAEKIPLFTTDLVNDLPQGLAARLGGDGAASLFRKVAVLRSPAGESLGVVAPVAGVYQLLFFFQRAANRLIEGDQRLRDQRSQRPVVGDQIVLQPLNQRPGDGRRHRGDNVKKPH